MRLEKFSSFLVVALFLSFWTLGAFPAHALCPMSNQEIEAVETLVQVGKYRLNFQVIEGGDLTILLEAGGGMDSNEWNNLAPELARKTGSTIVSYDRAGFGKSDLPETPHDMREEVEWLWQALQKLKLDKDLILVGHSFGGWMIRLIASEHPDAVRGIVFVDPFTNEFVDLLGVEYLDNHPMAGKLPFDTSQPDKLTKFQRAAVRMTGDGLKPKIEIMRKTSIPPDIPVVVITSGRPFLPKTEEQEAWRLSHEQMTASIEGAILVVAEESGHMIPMSQPDLIMEAVTKVLDRYSQTTEEKKEIGDLIEKSYIGAACNTIDIDILKKGFHESFTWQDKHHDRMFITTLRQWIILLEREKWLRPDWNNRTTAEIQVIGIEGNAAAVKVDIYNDRVHDFTDFLSVYKFTDGWKITNRISERYEIPPEVETFLPKDYIFILHVKNTL